MLGSSARTIAIGDIHGCANALRKLINKIEPQPSDVIVTLGDYIDRGPNSCDVIAQLLELRNHCQLVTLKGNHEDMMLFARSDPRGMPDWHVNGGLMTLDSYNDAMTWDAIPAEHFSFIESLYDYWETDTHIFVHANYEEDKPMQDQMLNTVIWRTLTNHMPGPHCSGKVAVVGHTIQPAWRDHGHLIAIDTGCFLGGPLTAIEVNTREVWEAWED